MFNVSDLKTIFHFESKKEKYNNLSIYKREKWILNSNMIFEIEFAAHILYTKS